MDYDVFWCEGCQQFRNKTFEKVVKAAVRVPENHKSEKELIFLVTHIFLCTRCIEKANTELPEKECC